MAALCRCSPYPVTGRKLAARVVCIFYFPPVFGDSWSSQTDFRLLWCLCVRAHLLKHDFGCWGRSAGAAAHADQRKANRAGHPLFTEGSEGLGRALLA